MNTLTYRACSVAYADGSIVVTMDSGAKICFAITDNPRLAGGTPEQLSHIEISPFGLHWPDLDEDLSFHGLLEENHGQFQKKSKVRPDPVQADPPPIALLSLII